MDLKDLDINELFIKETLFYAYKRDVNFPKSCGLVSLIMTYLLSYTELPKYYDIFCTRGCFKNEKEEDENFCEDYMEINRFNADEVETDCGYCDCCDFMISHSWIELINREKDETLILDFTAIQFEDNFVDYEEDLLNKPYSKDELYQYINERTNFIITKQNETFKDYIPLEVPMSLELITETTKSLYYKNITNNIIDMLNFSDLLQNGQIII